MPADNIQQGIMLPRELHERLRDAAARDGRSMASAIRVAVMQWVAAMDMDPGDKLGPAENELRELERRLRAHDRAWQRGDIRPQLPS